MPSEQGLKRTNASPQNYFLLLPQGLFKWQDHTSFFKWNSSQADLYSWAQPLTMENIPECYETNIGRKWKAVSMHEMDSSKKKKEIFSICGLFHNSRVFLL